MQNKKLLIEAQYFPPISYFAAVIHYKEVIIEQHENFQKSTYRNRCYISGPNGVLRLTVPLERGKHQRSKITDVKISYDEDWQKNHWQSICSCYRRSPFFEFYEDRFEKIFDQKWDYLFELNLKTLEMLLEIMDLEVPIYLSDEYEKEPGPPIINFRSKIAPGNPENISFFTPPKYRQVFEEKTGFFPDVSILDLLFNEGPNSKELLSQSII